MLHSNMTFLIFEKGQCILPSWISWALKYMPVGWFFPKKCPDSQGGIKFLALPEKTSPKKYTSPTRIISD